MVGSVSEVVSNLTQKIAEAFEQLITVRVQFQELRTFTKESSDEARRRIDRAEDRIDRIERERIHREAELTAKIDALGAKLDALSEQALHAAAEKAALVVMRELAEREKPASWGVSETGSRKLDSADPD